MQGWSDSVADDWITLCRRVVPEILRQRDWQLISEDSLPTFIGRVCETIVEGTVRPGPCASPEATVRRATIHCYCHELYRASGENGALCQRRAFEEIGRHAQGVAFRYEQTLAVVQVCVQRALVTIWEKRIQIRDPGSFLRWVETILYHEVKGYWKEKHRKQEITMSNLTPSNDSEMDDQSLQHFWETLDSIPPPDDEVIGQELREQLWAEVRHVLRGNRRYEAVVVGFYLYELSLPTLAELLQTPVRNVYVLKSRALARLRTDEAFVQRFADLLETGIGGGS
jgi:RNA polymerase sigma factor (sigma-70 family)